MTTTEKNTQKIHHKNKASKIKTGDLVRLLSSNDGSAQEEFGYGIVIREHEKSSAFNNYENRYWVFWQKKGKQYHSHISDLEKVIDND